MKDKNTNKTQANTQSVTDFLDAIADEQQRADSHELARMMQEISGWPPVMWGTSIVGFGTYHYKYASGREGDTMVLGFAPRKKALTLYGLVFYDEQRSLAERLGPHEEGKGCLYIKRLADVDGDVLRQLIAEAVKRHS